MLNLKSPSAPGCPGTGVVPLRTWARSAATVRVWSKEKVFSFLFHLSAHFFLRVVVASGRTCYGGGCYEGDEGGGGEMHREEDV